MGRQATTRAIMYQPTVVSTFWRLDEVGVPCEFVHSEMKGAKHVSTAAFLMDLFQTPQ